MSFPRSKRSTVKVADLRRHVNAYMAATEHETTPEARAARRAVADLLQDVLLATDNYMGFSYRDPAPFQEGVTDESARFYYAKKGT